MRLIAVGLFASLAIASPASAQAANPSAAEAKSDKREKAKQVCRTTVITGQRVPKRQCKTEAEWAGETVRDGSEDLRMKSVGSVVG